MREEDGTEMKLQGDEEGERAIAGIMFAVFMGGIFWVLAGFLLYVWFVA